MKKCPRCDYSMDNENAKFCKQCGLSLIQEFSPNTNTHIVQVDNSQKESKCPKCNNPVEYQNSKFCIKCGASLTAIEKPDKPPIDWRILITNFIISTIGVIALILTLTFNFCTATAPEIKEPELNIYFEGSIGGDNQARLSVNGESGYYEFINFTRIIKLKSYDADSEELILDGYDNKYNKYIGTFKGKLQKRNEKYYYEGIFTNYKGVSINFSLSEI